MRVCPAIQRLLPSYFSQMAASSLCILSSFGHLASNLQQVLESVIEPLLTAFSELGGRARSVAPGLPEEP